MFVEFKTIFETRVFIKPYDVTGLEGMGQHTAIICSRATYIVNEPINKVIEKLSPNKPIHPGMVEGD